MATIFAWEPLWQGRV